MKSTICLIIILSNLTAFAQDKVNWINFENLPSLQAQNKKPIFIYIHADWCVYCKKMERVSFKDKTNIDLLSNNFYALRLNLETDKAIPFDGNFYKNQELHTKRNPEHDLAKFLTEKPNNISVPAIVILNQNYEIIKRLHTYMSPKQLNMLLNDI